LKRGFEKNLYVFVVFTNTNKDLRLNHKGEESQMDNFSNDLNNFEGQPNHELNTRQGRSLRSFDDYGSRYDDDEFAAELLADNRALSGNSTSGALIAGGLGIVIALIAMFMHPLILGLIGAAMGIFAFAKGNKIVGVIAIIMGVIAAAVPMFHTGPFFTLF